MPYTMLTLPDQYVEHMDDEEFVQLATTILDQRGVDRYEDEWVAIRRNYNGLALEITRQEQDVEDGAHRSHLRVSNPTTMVVERGEIIRHHGEHCYVVWHMKRLAESA